MVEFRPITGEEQAVVDADLAWDEAEGARLRALNTSAWRESGDLALHRERGLRDAVAKLRAYSARPQRRPASSEATSPSEPLVTLSEPLVTVREAAEMLGVTEARVRQLIASGQLRMHQRDGRQHVERDQVRLRGRKVRAQVGA